MTPRELREERHRRVQSRLAAEELPTPGPGSYEPQRAGSTTKSLAGTSAFRSKSDGRFAASYLREMSDPGHYTVAYGTVADSKRAARSFHASDRKGAGGFGSVSKRFEFVIRSGPGAIYDVTPPWLDAEAKRGRQSAGFLTTVQRSAWVMRKGTRETPTFAKYFPDVLYFF